MACLARSVGAWMAVAGGKLPKTLITRLEKLFMVKSIIFKFHMIPLSFLFRMIFLPMVNSPSSDGSDKFRIVQVCLGVSQHREPKHLLVNYYT